MTKFTARFTQISPVNNSKYAIASHFVIGNIRQCENQCQSNFEEWLFSHFWQTNVVLFFR